jgi:phosphonate transport system substrate-binding protein
MMKMQTWAVVRGIILIIIFGLVSATSAYADDDPWLRFAVFPYTDSRTLIEQQAPFKAFLEKTLQRPLLMLTAPDFRTFMQRTLAGDYDLILSAPHMARYAEVRGHYQRIAMGIRRGRGVIVVRADSDIIELDDLRDRNIAMASPLSIRYQMALQMLSSHGLQTGRDVGINTVSNSSNALLTLLNGNAAAALIGIDEWDRLDGNTQRDVRLLCRLPSAPGVMLMANPQLPEPALAAFRAAVAAFNRSPASRDYFFAGFTPISEEAMRSLDPYLGLWKNTDNSGR